jgi:hypothetical protein
MRGGGVAGQGVDEDATQPMDIEPVVRRLSALAGERARIVAPSASFAAAAAAAGASASPLLGAPPSFLVNVSTATPASVQRGDPSFSSTPMLVRLTSSKVAAAAAAGAQQQQQLLVTPPQGAAAIDAPPPSCSALPSSSTLPTERRLVWTQSKSRREAWLLEEAKEQSLVGALTGLGEEENEEGVFEGGSDGDGANGGNGSKDASDEEDACGEDGPFGAPEDRRRLRRRLKRLALSRQRCEGDGNCLFRAVSSQLYGGSQEHHAAVRAAAVAHMLRRRDDYEAFLGEDFDAYVAGMATQGTWGDELALRALADALGVAVHVVTSDAGGWYHEYRPEEGEEGKETPPPAIFLAYLAPVHYEGLVPAAQQGQAAAAAGATAATAPPLQERPASAAAMCRAEA